MPTEFTYDPLESGMLPQAAPPELPLASLDELGQRLLRVLLPVRVRSLSIYDGAALRLWCSHGAADPDRQELVTQVLDALTLEPGDLQLLRTLPEGDGALFLALHDALGARRGVALARLDGAPRPDETAGLARTPRVAAILRRLGAVLAPAAADAPGPRPGDGEEGSADITASAPHARRYARLRAGGSTRRYELSAAGADAGAELASLQRLVEFLASHRERFQREPATFALPLSVATVVAGTLPEAAETLLLAAQVPAAQLGFSLPFAAWSQHEVATARFASECSGIGCFLVLEDFTLTAPGAASALAAPTLRGLKLDVALTARAMGDKLAQALLAGAVQAARVLGLYCVARQVESAHLGRWLASAGVEFADQPGRATGATSTRQRRVPLDLHGA